MSKRPIAIAALPMALFVGLSIWLAVGVSAQGAPVEIASTTTTTTATLYPVFTPGGIFAGFAIGQSAALYANADVNGDGKEDIIMVVVEPSAGPGAWFPAPVSNNALYRLYVANGLDGVEIYNISTASPAWY